MSHSPPGHRVYGYAIPPRSSLPPNYYYDDTEDYIGDYSESEGLSDGPHLGAHHPQPSPPPPNVTEIYRRKPNVAPSPSPPPTSQPPPSSPQAREHYRPNLYVPSSYYYDPVPTLIQQPLPRPAVPHHYGRRIPVVADRMHYYPAGHLEDAYGDAIVYGGPPIQTATVRRTVQPQPMPTMAGSHPQRRYPVTVPTPRYYRRAPASSIYKRPSALCLPLTCQPDPAVYRRTRKLAEQVTYRQTPAYTQTVQQQQQQQHKKPLERRHSVPVPSNSTNLLSKAHKTVQPPPLEDAYMTQSDVDAILSRYETIFDDQIVKSVVQPVDSESKRSKTKIGSHLKPKVPSNMKQKQKTSEKSKSSKEEHKKRSTSTIMKVEHLEVEEITPEVLDSMLSELIDTGCENKIQKGRQQQTKTVETESPPLNKPKESVATAFHQSFNYQDISQNMAKSQQELFPKSQPETFSRSQQEEFRSTEHKPSQQETFHKTLPESCSRTHQDGFSRSHHHQQQQQQQQQQREMHPKSLENSPMSSPRNHTHEQSHVSYNNPLRKYEPPKCCSRALIDDANALELHRSKSYIVNLIDRALSKELGTIAEESAPLSPAKELEQPDPRQVVENITKHSTKVEKGFSLDFGQNLMDLFPPNGSTVPHQSDVKHEMSCLCGMQDEPLYVKQLKQLRWGHLKHIQREVRRLEDLERFLDSCSSQPYL